MDKRTTTHSCTFMTVHALDHPQLYALAAIFQHYNLRALTTTIRTTTTVIAATTIKGNNVWGNEHYITKNCTREIKPK